MSDRGNCRGKINKCAGYNPAHLAFLFLTFQDYLLNAFLSEWGFCLLPLAISKKSFNIKPRICSPDESGLWLANPCCPDTSVFHDFVPQHNNFIMPASHRIHALRQSREACLKTLKINYQIAVSYQIAPTAHFAVVCYASLRRLLQNLG
jgi:hypothetical protein